MKIAIIDDGINEKYFDVGKIVLNLEVTRTLELKERRNYNPFVSSHGTICASIIKKYNPEATFISIKVLEDYNGKGSKEQLIIALQWCIDNRIRLVNLSLGTIDYRDFADIAHVIKKAIKHKIVIVAACSNRMVFTCPASWPTVIGVRCDLSGILQSGEYIYKNSEEDGIEIVASSRHCLINYKKEIEYTANSNSFAAPLITALISIDMQEKVTISIEQIKKKLYNNAKSIAAEEAIHMDNIFEEKRKEIEIPIVVIKSSRKQIHNVVGRTLGEVFRKNGYNAITVVGNIENSDFAEGLISLKRLGKSLDTDSWERILSNLSRVFNADIILMCLNEACYGEMMNIFNFDIQIHLMRRKYKEKDITKIYRHLQEVFENAETKEGEELWW